MNSHIYKNSWVNNCIKISNLWWKERAQWVLVILNKLYDSTAVQRRFRCYNYSYSVTSQYKNHLHMYIKAGRDCDVSCASSDTTTPKQIILLIFMGKPAEKNLETPAMKSPLNQLWTPISSIPSTTGDQPPQGGMLVTSTVKPDEDSDSGEHETPPAASTSCTTCRLLVPAVSPIKPIQTTTTTPGRSTPTVPAVSLDEMSTVPRITMRMEKQSTLKKGKHVKWSLWLNVRFTITNIINVRWPNKKQNISFMQEEWTMTRGRCNW